MKRHNRNSKRLDIVDHGQAAFDQSQTHRQRDKDPSLLEMQINVVYNKHLQGF